MLLSTGESGTARLWRQVRSGEWCEFADFGPERQEPEGNG